MAKNDATNQNGQYSLQKCVKSKWVFWKKLYYHVSIEFEHFIDVETLLGDEMSPQQQNKIYIYFSISILVSAHRLYMKSGILVIFL